MHLKMFWGQTHWQGKCLTPSESVWGISFLWWGWHMENMRFFERRGYSPGNITWFSRILVIPCKLEKGGKCRAIHAFMAVWPSREASCLHTNILPTFPSKWLPECASLTLELTSLLINSLMNSVSKPPKYFRRKEKAPDWADGHSSRLTRAGETARTFPVNCSQGGLSWEAQCLSLNVYFCRMQKQAQELSY